MTGRVEKIIFFLLVFFMPFQVGLHFWPSFSYVYGVRIDYLSPTLYLLDILVVLLFFFWLFRGKKEGISIPNKTISGLLLLFILSLLWSVFNSKSIGAHLFGVAKLVEFIFLAYYVATSFKKENIKLFSRILAVSSIITSVLGIWQFMLQSSVGGLWYFLGERTFSISTIGISTVNLGHQYLRAYAAFPHPNLLAFYLLLSIVFLFLGIASEKERYVKMLFLFSIVISSIALLLAFSRVSIFLLITFFFYAIYAKGKPNVRLALIVLLGIAVISLGVWVGINNTNFLLRGIDFREELLVQSGLIFAQNPYYGIGLNNFFINQAPLIKTISPIAYQPPHNIYVVALLSLGLFGFFLFPAIIVKAIQSLILKVRSKDKELKGFYTGTLIVLIGVLVVGLFDHFFLTLEQGQLILSLILGFSFVRLEPNSFKERKRKSRK